MAWNNETAGTKKDPAGAGGVIGMNKQTTRNDFPSRQRLVVRDFVLDLCGRALGRAGRYSFVVRGCAVVRAVVLRLGGYWPVLPYRPFLFEFLKLE
jgi:hypothetical protein